jgi:TPR repeat protein
MLASLGLNGLRSSGEASITIGMTYRFLFPCFLLPLFLAAGCSKSQPSPADPKPTPGSEFPLSSSNRNTRLGHAYELGEGVPVNLAVALAYFEKAAQEKDAEAQYRLGYALDLSNDRDLVNQAKVLYKLAAAQGHTEAAYEIGSFYQEEMGQPENKAKTLDWYRRAAEAGHAQACTRLGELYRSGDGVPKDPAKAAEWFEEGASRGDPGSMEKLASMYQSGEAGPLGSKAAATDAQQEHDYWLYRSYLAGRCKNAFWLKGMDQDPRLLELFKERARKDLGADVKLDLDGDWRIHPVEKPGTARYWALAVSALLVEMNHGQHERLGTFSRDHEKYRRNIAWLMFNSWGISSRADLFEKLEGLQTRGHRSQFDAIAAALEAEKNGDRNPIQRLRRQGVSAYRINLVKKEASRLKSRSLLGFDYSRYVTLCRWGYLVGYLSEEEAWERIMAAARILRKTFDSWEDLSNNYLVGRRFLSVSMTADSEAFSEKASIMLINRNYPWKECPWEVDIPEH